MTATEALLADLKLWACSPRIPLKAQLVMIEAIGRLSAPPEVARRELTGETPRTDAVKSTFTAMLNHAEQLERELAGLAAIYRASVKMVEETIPSPLVAKP